MQDTSKYILIRIRKETPPKKDRKPPLTRRTHAQARGAPAHPSAVAATIVGGNRARGRGFAGGGQLGAASSESAVGFAFGRLWGRLRGCACALVGLDG
jgi:hypothetical protein